MQVNARDRRLARRPALGAAGVAVLLVSLSACGGDDEAATRDGLIEALAADSGSDPAEVECVIDTLIGAMPVDELAQLLDQPDEGFLEDLGQVTQECAATAGAGPFAGGGDGEATAAAPAAGEDDDGSEQDGDAGQSTAAEPAATDSDSTTTTEAAASTDTTSPDDASSTSAPDSTAAPTTEPDGGSDTTDPPAATTTEPPATTTTELIEFVSVESVDGTILVDVPSTWTDVRTPVTGERNVLHVSTDVDAYLAGWDVDGVTIDARPVSAVDPEMRGVMDLTRAEAACTRVSEEEYDDGTYVGFIRRYEDCGGTQTAALVVGSVEEDLYEVVVEAQVGSGNEDIFQTILDSFLVF